MQEKNKTLDTPVRYLKGVGPKRGAVLERLGLKTIGDLLYYLPKRYEDRSDFTPISALKPGESKTVTGEVITSSLRRTRSGQPIFQIAVSDHSGIVHAVWFNQPYMQDYIKRGQKVILYGRVEMYDKLQIVQPEYEIIDEDEKGDSVNIGRIVPIYGLTEGLNQRFLRTLTDEAIGGCVRQVTEMLPAYIIARNKLVDAKFAVKNIHFPASFENLERAYRRIVFEEFFMLQLALALRKKSHGPVLQGLRHKAGGELVTNFLASVKFELTDGQKKAIADIERDMTRPLPMNRLLEGDVGSGKTVVSAYALTLTVENGYQGVLMAPTEILARQHYISLSELLMPLGVNVTLLVGGMDKKARAAVCADIKEGRANVIVGTHAIIEEEIEFSKLGLAVIDEQHKFGVTQRAILKNKGYNPHILVMTATPIPRTLAMTVYGDLDISIIKELPKGRKPIATYWVEEAKREDIYNFIKEELAKGRQAYVVCPLIDGRPASKAAPLAEAAETFENLRNNIFKGSEVGLLHGRLSTQEKERVMKDFKKGKIQVLVSTVVIEVGIDVSNATVMMVENAERFGLSQLHQLRGRIGRGAHESYCILLADPKTDKAVERLKAIENTLDGFEIAEADLEIRGPGDFLGTRQHGLPEIRFGNILKDHKIMEEARRVAQEVVAKDPTLSEEHHAHFKRRLSARFRGRFELAGVA